MTKLNNNRWVDLSVLPKKQKGNNLVIDWIKSIGCNIPFRYDDVCDYIRIVDYKRENKEGVVTITVPKYAESPIRMQIGSLLYCQLSHLFENKIADKYPEIIPYLLHPEDAYQYAYQSNKPILFKCPFCGKTSEQYINNVYRRGFFCECLSDGISLPNKLMANILDQLHIPYKREVGRTVFAWIGEYYYDFYFKINSNQNILVEMDGRYHDEVDCQERDRIKDLLAKENGFQLIRIDCKYKGEPIEYIKHSILDSELKDILNLESIDWNRCKEIYKTHAMLKACEIWETTFCTISDIAKHLKMDNRTIAKYLKRGVVLGLCPSYSYAEAQNRNSSRQIAIIDNDRMLRVFFNSKECATTLQNETGMRFTAKGVSNCAYGYNKSYHKYQFKHITREEYEQYKMIEQNKNIEVVSKGDDIK